MMQMQGKRDVSPVLTAHEKKRRFKLHLNIQSVTLHTKVIFFAGFSFLPFNLIDRAAFGRVVYKLLIINSAFSLSSCFWQS